LYKEACKFYKIILYKQVFLLNLKNIRLLEKEDIDIDFQIIQDLINTNKKNLK
jgi:hypothetical protein